MRCPQCNRLSRRALSILRWVVDESCHPVGCPKATNRDAVCVQFHMHRVHGEDAPKPDDSDHIAKGPWVSPGPEQVRPPLCYPGCWKHLDNPALGAMNPVLLRTIVCAACDDVKCPRGMDCAMECLHHEEWDDVFE